MTSPGNGVWVVRSTSISACKAKAVFAESSNPSKESEL